MITAGSEAKVGLLGVFDLGWLREVRSCEFPPPGECCRAAKPFRMIFQGCPANDQGVFGHVLHGPVHAEAECARGLLKKRDGLREDVFESGFGADYSPPRCCIARYILV